MMEVDRGSEVAGVVARVVVGVIDAVTLGFAAFSRCRVLIGNFVRHVEHTGTG